MKPDYSNLRNKTPLDFTNDADILLDIGMKEMSISGIKDIDISDISIEERIDYLHDYAELVNNKELMNALMKQFPDKYRTPELEKMSPEDLSRYLCWVYRPKVKINIDYKKLKGRDLMNFFVKKHCRKEDDVDAGWLLHPGLCLEYDQSIKLLERIVREGKKLYVYYPEFDETDISNMEFVGYVDDGAVYIR